MRPSLILVVVCYFMAKHVENKRLKTILYVVAALLLVFVSGSTGWIVLGAYGLYRFVRYLIHRHSSNKAIKRTISLPIPDTDQVAFKLPPAG